MYIYEVLILIKIKLMTKIKVETPTTGEPTKEVKAATGCILFFIVGPLIAFIGYCVYILFR